jgi:predicted small secreted protein|tara:strand:+ start:23893 stop:24078 length:186 start_codon:yes stop_codon:yes gene_type:complete
VIVKLINQEEQKMKYKTYYSKIKSVLTVLLLSSALGACATIEGAGKDIESAGEVIQDAAEG